VGLRSVTAFENARPRLVTRVAAALALGALAACTAQPQRSLVGVWKSDAARTLESMRATPGIPDDRRRALESDYYGHLVIEYTADTVRAHFDNNAYDSGPRPYRVLDVEPGLIVTSEWNELLGAFEESRTYLDGGCLYGLAADFGYREYFCPFKE